MTWWNTMSQTGKGAMTVVALVLGALGTAFGLGAATARTVDSHQNLPTRMIVVEQRVDTLRVATAYLMHMDSVRVGVWGSVSQVTADVAETRCYVRAMALKRDPLVDCSALLNPRRP